MKDRFEVDLCSGPVLRKVILFAIPLMLSNVLQLLFHITDLVVIGQYSSHEALAAVGCTGSLNNLFIGVFIGISVGANVLAARYCGAKDAVNIGKVVHTAIFFACVGGVILTGITLILAKPLLIMMETPEEILPKACHYLWISFCGLPFLMLYNYGCSILRAVGDTKRPFLFLLIGGIVNVLLNLFFVLVCGMDVEGVAIATVVSHVIAASLILITLHRTSGDFRLRFRNLKPDSRCLKDMLRIGIPAGVQGACFSVSNMVIQSSINSFGSYAMAGITAAVGVEGIVYSAQVAFHYAAISFVAQNMGGHHYKRVLRSIYSCYICAFAICVIFGYGFWLFGKFFLSIYSDDPQVIEWGLLRMKITFTTYFILGIMDAGTGCLRGLGYSVLSAVISLSGACFFRIFWVLTILPRHHTMECLLVSYPVSWGLVAVLASAAVFIIYRKMVRTQCIRRVEWSKLGPGLPKGYRLPGGPR